MKTAAPHTHRKTGRTGGLLAFPTAVAGVLLLVSAAVSLFVSFTNRIENDAAFHAQISREIAERRSIISSSAYLFADASNGFPVAYPQLFHLIGALGYQIGGTDAFRLLPALFGWLAMAYFYGLLKRLFNVPAFVLIGVFMVAFNGFYIDYSSKYFMEIALVFGTMASLYYAVKYADTKSAADMVLASFFFGATVSIKQQGFFLLPVFVLMLLAVSVRHRLHTHAVTGIIVCLIAMAAPVMHLFASTGSILYAGDNPPRIVEMVEKPLREVTGVRLLTSDPRWPELNEGRRAAELERWRSVSALITAWLSKHSAEAVPWTVFGVGMLVVSLSRLYRRRPVGELMVLLFIVSFSGLFYVLARPRYTLPLIILPSVIVVYVGYALMRLPLARHTSVLFTALLIVFTMDSFATDLLPIATRDRYGFMGREYANRDRDLAELYRSVGDNGANPFILSPVPYETVFYTHKPVIWANPYGATNLFQSLLGPEEAALPVLASYRAGYLIVYTDRTFRYTNWVGITPLDGFIGNMDTARHFQKIASNQTGSVYKISYE